MIVLNGAAATRTVLYSAWFCPFAQRAWCALNELDIPYELVESLKVDPQTEAYIKDERLLKANPKGLVPTIEQFQHSVIQDDNEEKTSIICDSMQILEDLYCEQHKLHGENKSIMSVQNLYQEAVEWNKVLCSTPFYAVLMKQVPEERDAAWNDLQQGLALFSEHLHFTEDAGNGTADISFYKSDFANGSSPSLVDFCVFPFVHRLYIIEHYKGLKLSENTNEERGVAKKIYAWRDKMEALPSVQKTLANPKDLIPIYLRYADGTAKSKVGDSIRQGKQVHDV